jgi:hypothetical protein
LKTSVFTGIYIKVLEPLCKKLEIIDATLKKYGIKIARYCRNDDLKKHFALSSNTIIKYRQKWHPTFYKA